MFNTLIVQPIFNVLVIIYALLPGHNFGLAIILFTVLIRMLMWPLVKKQLHHAKAMRALQPELKRIKKEANGDRARESALTMELYKERQVNPFSSIGLLIVQIPIFLGLYSGISRIVNDPSQLVSFAYPWVQNLSWMQELATDIGKLDETLFGIVDLTRAAYSGGVIYWPAMIIVVASVIAQYLQSKQLMPSSKDKKSLRDILQEASAGKKADQSDMQAAISSKTLILIPGLIFLVTVNLASALSLYFLVSSLVALIQQTIILRQDEEELEAIADSPTKVSNKTTNKKEAIEGEVIPPKNTKKKTAKTAKKSKAKQRKRRK